MLRSFITGRFGHLAIQHKMYTSQLSRLTEIYSMKSPKKTVTKRQNTPPYSIKAHPGFLQKAFWAGETQKRGTVFPVARGQPHVLPVRHTAAPKSFARTHVPSRGVAIHYFLQSLVKI